MGNCEDGSCCTQDSCDTKPKGMQRCSTGCEMTDMVLDVADKAWEELMKQKMKALWEKQMGPHMDKLAAAGVEGSMAYWGHIIDGKTKAEASKSKIREVMTSK